MASRSDRRAIVILGTNASGKSGLGVRLAGLFNGEIISADSRQVYRGLDLGSGKLTSSGMAGIAHHLIDVAEPATDTFTLFDFQTLCKDLLVDISARGKVPFIVGGTGLYIRSVVEDYQLSPVPPDWALRNELQGLGADELHRRGVAVGIPEELPSGNHRRYIRMIEQAIHGVDRPWHSKKGVSETEFLMLGMTWPREVLRGRIRSRLESRIEMGMIDEVRNLRASGVPDGRLYEFGLEYRYILNYLQGEFESQRAMTEGLEKAIFRFAKRQQSWFARDRNVIWLTPPEDADALASERVEHFLQG